MYTRFLSGFLLLLLPFCSFAKVPKLWNIDSHSTIVTGRETELADIHTLLNKQKEDLKILAITGLPGFGKTEISKAYAKTYKDEYDVCWLFDSKRELFPQLIEFSYRWNKSFPNNQITITENKRALLKEIKHVLKKSNLDLLFILDNINPEKESIASFKNALRSSTANWLIIFDNAPDFEFIKDLIPAHHTNSKGHVLVTSQNTSSWPTVYRLNVLNKKTVMKLFNVGNSDRAELENIAQCLKYHPFAIYNAYKEIKSQQYSLKEYANSLQNFKGKPTLNPAIEMTQMHIEKFISENPQANEIIELLYLMDNHFIPDYLLRSLWVKMGYSEEKLTLLLAEAGRRLILDPPQRTGAGIKFYKYHDIVKSAFEQSITKEKQLQMVQALAYTLSSRTEIDEAPYLTENFHHKVPIIENITYLSNAYKVINPSISDLYLNEVEYFALISREFHRCINFIANHENINKYISLSAPKEQAIRFHTTLSGIYWWLGDHKQGLFHQQHAEQVSKEIKKTDTLQFERILNYAASHYLFLGEADKALEYITKLQIINDGKGKIDDDKFDTTNLIDLNRTNYFNLVGDYQKSVVLADKIFSKIKDKSDKRFLYHIPVYIIRYETYLYINDPTFSLSEITNTTSKLSEALGDQHRLTARTRVLLAGHLIHHGRISDAKELLLQQIVILEDWFGPKTHHKEKALAYVLLGDCFYAEKNFSLAKGHYERAYEQYHHGFTNMKNNEIRRILFRLIAVNVAMNENLIVHKLLSDYKRLFGKDKKYDQLIISLATKRHLKLSELQI